MKLDPSLGASLDPGKWKMGLAVSQSDPGQAPLIAYAAPVRVTRPWTPERAVHAVFYALRGFTDRLPARWTIEHPRVYGGAGRAASKGDVEQLEDFAERMKRELRPLGAKVDLVRPHAWKGNVAKKVHHKRGHRALTPAERVLLQADYGDAHLDVWDAICIELWALGRTGRGGTKPAQGL